MERRGNLTEQEKYFPGCKGEIKSIKRKGKDMPRARGSSMKRLSEGVTLQEIDTTDKVKANWEDFFKRGSELYQGEKD